MRWDWVAQPRRRIVSRISWFSYGCSFCEWYYLYDAQGKQLTRSEPILIEDPSLPEGQEQLANNREFEALLTRLGMQMPEMAFVEQ